MYINLILDHSKGQRQGYTNFDCEYFETVTDRTNNTIADTGNHLLAFE